MQLSTAARTQAATVTQTDPHSRLGWLRTLQVRTVIRPLGMEFRGLRQPNVCEANCK